MTFFFFSRLVSLQLHAPDVSTEVACDFYFVISLPPANQRLLKEVVEMKKEKDKKEKKTKKNDDHTFSWPDEVTTFSSFLPVNISRSFSFKNSYSK